MKRMNVEFFKKMAGIGLSCLLLGGHAVAQDMLDGSFTGNFPPRDWNVEAAAGSRSWSVAWGGGADGGNYTLLYAQDANVMNDAWMVSPQVRPSDQNHQLVFHTRKAAADTTDMTLGVYVSATGNRMADFSGPALMVLRNTASEQDFSLSWKPDTLDLSAYIGQDIFVAFRVQENSVQLGLDEISGLPLSVFETDFRINELSLVPDKILFAGGEAVRLQALVENRVNEESSVTVSFSVDGQVVGTDVVRFDSAYVDTASVEYAFAEAKTYSLRAEVPEDDNNINNEQTLSLQVYPENFLMEDFHANKPFPPAEWQVVVEAGTTGISRMSTGAATSSLGYVNFTRAYSSSAASPSVRWLVTPQLRPDASNHEFGFYLRRGSIWGTPVYSAVSVMVSMASSDPASFQAELAKYEYSAERDDLGGTSWQYFTVDVSAYQGQDIFLAFRVEDHNTVGWDLDEAGGLPLASFAEDARIRMLSLADPDRYWFAGDEMEILAVVDNYGTEDMENVAVSLEVNGLPEAEQSLALASKEVSDTLVFRFSPEEAGSYVFEVSVPEDDNLVNNAMNLDPVQVYPEGFFIEGFEGTTYTDFPPAYWDVEQTSYGGNGWNSGSGSFAYRGNNYAYSQTGCRLMTPLLQIGEEDSLCFYANTTWASTVYAILISADARTWDTVQIDTLYGSSGSREYELRKIYFNECPEAFYGNRYLAIVNTLNNMNIDEVFGPMLASREDQFSMVSLFADPDQVSLAGQESRFYAVVYNDGTQALSKEVSLYQGEEFLVSAQTADLRPGEYDTVALTYSFADAVSNGAFRATLPQDASVYDNEAELSSHVYEPGIWRLEEGFEDAGHPYWTFDDTRWTGMPSYNAVEPAGGENYLNRAFSSSTPALAVSPYMELPFGTYEVSLDVYRNSATADRPDKIEIGIGPKPVWENVVFIDSINRLATAYPQGSIGWDTYVFHVDVESLEGGFFMIRAVGAVNQYNSPSYENLPVDNLVIRPYLAQDAEIAGILNPADTVWGGASVKSALSVRLLNSGYENLEAATLAYGRDSVELGRVEWTGVLASGADTVLRLTEDLELPAGPAAALYVEVLAEGDGNTLNDRLEKELSVKPAYELPFVAGFEDSLWAKDWRNFSFSPEGLSWRRDTTGDFITAPFGTGCAYSASMDDDLGAVNPDNWLVTPGLRIEHPEAWLSFYVQAADPEYFAEAYSVLVSTRSDRDTAFFTAIYADTLASDSLQHVVLPLDGYKDEVLNIAFRHFNCTDQYRLLLDSVHVFYPELFQVTAMASPAEAGSVEGAGEYILDEEVELTATANEGWRFSGWYLDGDPVSSENPYRFACEGDADYEARFEEISYTITLSAGEGGSVDPEGAQTVVHGSDLAVTITADEGYLIEDVLVDGVSVGAVATYTFEDVNADHSLEATFLQDVANEAGEAAGLRLYPNPYTEELHLESALPMERVRILDLQGREAAAYELDGQRTAVLHPALPEGLYLLMVEYAEGQVTVLRVVKADK